MTRIQRPTVTPVVSSNLIEAPKPAAPSPVDVASVSSFSAKPLPSLPAPSAPLLVPRPVPEVEVPGVGRLSEAQAQAVLESARSATRQLQQYAQFHHASVSAETLGQISDAGALRALKELGYPPPADPVQMRAEIGEVLAWARAPFALADATSPSPVAP